MPDFKSELLANEKSESEKFFPSCLPLIKLSGKIISAEPIKIINSTNLLSSLSHLGVHRATSIQTFDFSTLYTSIPHDLLKSHMNSVMPLNTKLEVHNTPTSKLAEIKAISPVIL